uniref:Uncharacterized protein n=1 Tax=Lygus hesperus TaxID=30085 RepID=A0A0A9YYM5_LYGHE
MCRSSAAVLATRHGSRVCILRVSGNCSSGTGVATHSSVSHTTLRGRCAAPDSTLYRATMVATATCGRYPIRPTPPPLLFSRWWFQRYRATVLFCTAIRLYLGVVCTLWCDSRVGGVAPPLLHPLIVSTLATFPSSRCTGAARAAAQLLVSPTFLLGNPGRNSLYPLARSAASFVLLVWCTMTARRNCLRWRVSVGRVAPTSVRGAGASCTVRPFGYLVCGNPAVRTTVPHHCLCCRIVKSPCMDETRLGLYCVVSKNSPHTPYRLHPTSHSLHSTVVVHVFQCYYCAAASTVHCVGGVPTNGPSRRPFPHPHGTIRGRSV